MKNEKISLLKSESEIKKILKGLNVKLLKASFYGFDFSCKTLEKDDFQKAVEGFFNEHIPVYTLFLPFTYEVVVDSEAHVLNVNFLESKLIKESPILLKKLKSLRISVDRN